MSVLIKFLTVFITLSGFIKAIDSDTCEVGFYFNGKTCEDCGTTSIQSNIRIVGGTEAVKGSWPFQALVVQYVYISQFQSTFRFSCGGTLINKRTVLSASHCIVNKIMIGSSTYDIVTNSIYPTWESMFKIYLGAHNISFLDNNEEPDPSVVVSGVTKIIKHESYDPIMEKNDISLFIIEKTITPNSIINIACLPSLSNMFPSNSIAYVSGWGRLSEYGATSDVLYNVKLNIYDPSYCSVYTDTNWDAQICAGYYQGGKDTCQGDSGSGLQIRQQIYNKTKYIVAGIVSYGLGCGHPNTAGIYTRTSHYIDWIKANWAVESDDSICQYGTYYNGLSCEDCGRISNKNSSTEWSINVLVVHYNGSNNEDTLLSYCVGTLITKNVILSTANCIPSNQSEIVSYAIFTNNQILSLSDLTQASLHITVVRVSNIKRHPTNNLALFLVENSMQISSQYVLSCLPYGTDSYVKPNRTVYEYGWKSIHSDSLSFFNRSLFATACDNITTNSSELCAQEGYSILKRTNNLSYNSCQSILIEVGTVDDGSSIFVIIGFSIDSCQSSSKRVFTKSITSLDWIKENMLVETPLKTTTTTTIKLLSTLTTIKSSPATSSTTNLILSKTSTSITTIHQSNSFIIFMFIILSYKL